MRIFMILLLFISNKTHAGPYQWILNTIDQQMDRYFIMRNSDQTCTNMFINHIDTVNQLMKGKDDQSIKAWGMVGVTPQDGDKHWYQYLKRHKLLPESDSSEHNYHQLLKNIQYIKGNAGLYFQGCLKDVWRARLQCSRQYPLEHRQEINECIKKQEELILLKQISSASYFGQLDEKEQESVLKHAKEIASLQKLQED
jgi:hypothetical protein